MPKLSNPTAKQKRKMLDRRWSEWIVSHGKCEAGSQIKTCNPCLTCSHIIGRTYVKVQFDPRNQQCICGTEHGILEHNPMLFAKFVESTSCGKYVNTMLVQANSMTKMDYDLWFDIYRIVNERGYSLEESREWLGQTIMLSTLDLSKLD